LKSSTSIGPKGFRVAGTSILEYALPCTLVALVVVTAIGIMGITLKETLPQMLHGTNGIDAQENTLELYPQGSVPYTETIQFSLADGTKIQLKNYPTNMKALVDVLGPSGTTEILADALAEMAHQLQQKGKIPPDQANKLENLANSGHRWANDVSFFENAANDSKSNLSMFKAKTISQFQQFQEKQLPLEQINPVGARAFGLKDSVQQPFYDANGLFVRDASGHIVFDSNNYSKAYYMPQYAQFVNAYGKAAQTGVLKDPVINHIVMDLSQNITNIGNKSLAAVTELHVNEYNKNNPSQLKQAVSKEIHEESGNICSVGGGKDFGIHCPSSKKG
jgi:Flp pilus assembly pilin Flp